MSEVSEEQTPHRPNAPGSMQADDGQGHGQLAAYLLATGLLYLPLQIYLFLQSWFVFEFTDSPYQVGLVAGIQTAPWLFAPIVGGVCADIFDRRRLLVVASLLFACLLFAEGTMIGTGVVTMQFIYVFAIATAAVGMFVVPAHLSFLANLLRRGFNFAIVNLTMVIGPIIGGLLISLLGNGTAFVVAGSMAILAAIVFQMMGRPMVDNGGLSAAVISGIGISIPTLITLLVLAAFLSILTRTILTLLPVLARDTFAVTSSVLGVLISFWGLGAFFGGVVVGIKGRHINCARWVPICGLVSAIIAVAFTQVGTIVVASAMVFVIGGLVGVTLAMLVGLLLRDVTDHWKGKVIGFYGVAGGISPIWVLFVGALAQRGGPTASLAAGAILLAVVCVIAAVPLWRTQS